jgi:hypothetical protein
VLWVEGIGWVAGACMVLRRGCDAQGGIEESGGCVDADHIKAADVVAAMAGGRPPVQTLPAPRPAGPRAAGRRRQTG